jgi:thioredoxin 1
MTPSEPTAKQAPVLETPVLETLVLETNDAGFEKEVLKADQLTLVDFWAEWCAPCRMLAPTLEAVATQFQGKVQVRKINVDENPATPAKFHIRSIPTVLLFRGGQVVDQLVGNQPKEVYLQAISKQLHS